MRYEGETGNSPWNDEGPVRAAVRQTRSWAPHEETPNVTDIPVPGDPVPCTGVGDEWFLTKPVEIEFAKKSCAGCWMREDCAEYGIEHPDESGVWGGLTQRERRNRYRVRHNIPVKREGRGITRSKRWS